MDTKGRNRFAIFSSMTVFKLELEDLICHERRVQNGSVERKWAYKEPSLIAVYVFDYSRTQKMEENRKPQIMIETTQF
jgi:hypothetical protein